VLDDNVAMRHLLTKAGAKLRLDEVGVLRTTLRLPETTERFAPDAVLAIARSAPRAEEPRAGLSSRRGSCPASGPPPSRWPPTP
jgi:hypothetical protein